MVGQARWCGSWDTRHGCVGGAVSRDDGVGYVGKVISIYPYVPLTSSF